MANLTNIKNKSIQADLSSRPDILKYIEEFTNNNDSSITIKKYNGKELRNSYTEVLDLTDFLKKKGYKEGKNGKKYYYFSNGTLTINSTESPKLTSNPVDSGMTSFEQIAYGSGIADTIEKSLSESKLISLQKQILKIQKLLK